ncbi:MAG: ABC transporter permease subunit [Blautia faecis]
MESTLSLEMIEAARIDGSKEWNTFNKIILPIMKPAVATQAIFQFIAQWNNLFTPTILLTTDSKKTLPMFVQLLSSNQFRTDYGVVYVGSVCYHYPSGCCIPGTFQVHRRRCCTWRC